MVYVGLIFWLILALPAYAGQTTFTVGAGTDDGDIYKASSPSYPPSGSATCAMTDTGNFASRGVVVTTYNIRNMLMQWDTSSLSGKTPTQATLEWDVLDKADTDARNITCDWYNWGASCDSSDYSESAQTGALSGYDITSISVADNQQIVLDNVTGVSTTGTTYLRCHVSGGSPTGSNYIQAAMYEHATKDPPKLIVDWTEGDDSGPAGASVIELN